MFYTAATANASDVITAVSAVADTVTILNGETPVASGAAATWGEGLNTVTITVVVTDVETAVYTVWVTYTPA